MTIYCPHCRSILNKRTPRHCPECGAICTEQQEPAAVLERASRGSLAEQPSKAYQEMVAPLIQAGRDAVEQKRQWAGPETMKEREWAVATDRERLHILLDAVEGSDAVIESLTQRLAAAEVTIKSLKETIEGRNGLDALWAQAARHSLALDAINERDEALQQRLTASELAIKGLQEKLADTVDCPPSCECQPAAAEFTPEQMASAINNWLEFGERMLETKQQMGYFSGDSWAARALRAARDHILAGKAAG